MVSVFNKNKVFSFAFPVIFIRWLFSSYKIIAVLECLVIDYLVKIRAFQKVCSFHQYKISQLVEVKLFISYQHAIWN